MQSILLIENYLTELVSRSYEFKWTKSGDGVYQAHFRTRKGAMYEVEFLKVKDFEVKELEIDSFYAAYFYPDKLQSFFDRTNEGDPFRILTTVFKVLKEFLVKHPLEVVRFSGGDFVQDRVYEKALNKYSSKYGLKYHRIRSYFFVELK